MENTGKIIAVSGSVVEVFFDKKLPQAECKIMKTEFGDVCAPSEWEV